MYTFLYNVCMYKLKSYKVKDARANLSQLIKELNDLGDCFVIEKRSTPRAAVIPYEEAIKLFPSLSTYSAQESFYDFVENFLPKIEQSLRSGELKTKRKTVDISGTIDKALYGI